MNKQIRLINGKLNLPEDEIKNIDQAILELKAEIGEMPVGQEEQVINTLINIYNSKLMVLKKLSDQIESDQQGDESIINL